MDQLADFLGRQGYLPHGYCFTWQPGLLWPMVVSDILIALAYFSIPVVLMTLVRRRRDPLLKAPAWLFSAFIFACGITHLMDVWVIWQPDYHLQLLFKALTAIVSVITAVVLWPMLPKALKIPTPAQFQAAIDLLEEEVGQRKSVEESLSDTQEALVITLASIGAGFIATDKLGRVTRMNAVAEALTGWTQEEAFGQSYWQVMNREDRSPELLDKNPIDVLVDLGSSIDQVHRVVLVARDGTRTMLDVQAALTYAPDRSIKGMAILMRDMTRLNEAETEGRRLAAIIESSQDAIIGKKLDGTITSWNQGAEHIFGYAADEAIGQPIQMLIPAERKVEEMLIISNLTAGVRVPPFETKRLRKDGTLIDVSVTISPIKDATGQVVGASKIARDISQQKQTEELRLVGQRLEAENRQIQEASRLKSEFLANMSHELRTPLNAIIGFADLLHAGVVPVESPKHQAFLGHIGTSGRHLLQLINDVLDLSKVEAGKLEFMPEAVQLSQVVKEVTEILQSMTLGPQVRIETHIDPAVEHMVIDPARLKQVLYNYLSNALKFTPGGGLVSLRSTPEGSDRVRIEVEDSGIGISAKDLPRLFVAFQQLNSSPNKSHPGTGLGLALTRRLVQAQGGTVGVRSTPGVGSVFHVVLKRVNQPLTVHESDADSTQRFLMIHGDGQAQTALAGTLSRIGFTVDEAASGEEAIAKAREQNYTAISLDLVMPDRPGLEVLLSIRTEGLSIDTPVLAVSMATDHARASFPITDVLAKPIQTNQIGTALAKAGLLNRPGAQVMVIDDDPMALALMGATLDGLGLRHVDIGGGLQALSEIDQHLPDAIILDLMMPEFDGFEVLAALGHHPTWRQIPVFIWTSMLLTDEEYRDLARSAHAILNKGGGGMQSLLQDIQRRCATVVATPEGQA